MLDTLSSKSFPRRVWGRGLSNERRGRRVLRRLSYRDCRVRLDGRDIGVTQFQEPNPERTRRETVIREGQRVRVMCDVDGVDSYVYPEADDELILHYKALGLEYFVAEKLKIVSKAFGAGAEEHSRPLAEWWPQLVDHCPDLLTALWYQFAQIVAEQRPLKRCEVCGNPLPYQRSTRKTCNDACRKAKSRRARR